MPDIKSLLIVFAGSGFGGMLRYCMQYWLTAKSENSFPAGTFAVNIIGCFCIGVVYGLAAKYQWLPEWRLALATGFCGGFTTFSAFAAENVMLMRNGNYTTAVLYILLSVILGIACTFAGISFFKHP